jgi:hypothetical protein
LDDRAERGVWTIESFLLVDQVGNLARLTPHEIQRGVCRSDFAFSVRPRMKVHLGKGAL